PFGRALQTGTAQVSASAFPPAGAAVPLILRQSPLAALWVGRESAIGRAVLRLLGSIADIAATAIHRAPLCEETERSSNSRAERAALGRSGRPSLPGLLCHALAGQR